MNASFDEQYLLLIHHSSFEFGIDSLKPWNPQSFLKQKLKIQRPIF